MSDQLGGTDKLYWGPAASLIAWLAGFIPEGDRVLEIGPNKRPFPRANVLVDMAPRTPSDNQEFVLCEVGAERLPFPDKHFDFVYCRHTLEDMADPFVAMREIERVAKSGYLETPSPVAELCRGVEICNADEFGRGGMNAPWRGYTHHHWIVWSHGGELRFCTKFPMVEHGDASTVDLAGLLRKGPRYWNTYHLWHDRIGFVHREVSKHYQMPAGYAQELTDAIWHSVAATDLFWNRMNAWTARAA